MKKSILAFFTIAALASCDRVTQSLAIKHNDEIISQSDKVIDAFDALSNSLTSYNIDSIDKVLKDYNAEISNSLQKINTAVPLKDSVLKVATIEMLGVFKAVGDNEFTKIRNIYALPDSLYSKTEEDEVTALANAIDEKIETAQTKQRNVQKAFAKKYNFVLLVGKDTIK